MSDAQAARPAAAVSAAQRRKSITGVAKFPPDRKRSAVIAALRAAQHENNGFLTAELMDAVAAYLQLPPIQVYEVASFYSMFETKPVGRHHVSVCTNISCMLCGGEEIAGARREDGWASRSARARPTAASSSSVKRSAWPPAPVRR